jgi:hypothetical protein
MTLVAVGGCASPDASAHPTLVVEADTLGDTLVVRTVSGSEWGRPGELVEELSIGVLEGPDELVFGEVRQMAADGIGGVYVFDRQGPTLRHYDAAGQYVQTLGGEGSGPGEYRDAALGLAVRADGSVLLYDPGNARLNLYDSAGRPTDHWAIQSGLYGRQIMALDTAGHVYLRILLGQPERNQRWRMGTLHLDPEGQLVDTIPEPPFPGTPEETGWFLPRKHWAWSPLGYLVVGVSDEYVFELRRSPSSVLRVEKPYEIVRLLPEERREWEVRNEWIRDNRGQFFNQDLPPIPASKPPYAGLYIGQFGRIWVHRHVVAEHAIPSSSSPEVDGPPLVTWQEPTVYDVFSPEGAYLGDVRVPDRVTIHVFRGDEVWGVRRGEFDEEYVVRFRVEYGQ